MMDYRFRSIETLVVGLALLASACCGCGRGPKIPTASVSGTVTINGRAIANVEVSFHSLENIRPAFGYTDASGRYSAQFLMAQSGVPLGPCVVKMAYRPNGFENILPDTYDSKAADNPALHLTVPKEGTTFNFDVKTDKPLP